MEAFPPYGQKKLQTESHPEESRAEPWGRDSSQHGSGSPGLPCQDYTGSSDASANKSPTFVSEVGLFIELRVCHLELKESLLLYTVSYSLYQKIFSNYPTRGKSALPELAQLISDTGHLHPAFLECVCNLSSLPLSFRAASATMQKYSERESEQKR